MKRAILLVAAILGLTTACGSRSERVEGDLVVTADRLFDGERTIEDAAVVVKGRSVVAAGRRDEIDARAERTIDLGDATVLPGFVDLHVHAFGEGMLLGGVTTVRDLGAPIDALPPPAARPGRVRVLAAGPIVTVPGGYPGTVYNPRLGLAVRGPADARRAVADLVRRGASVIKISLEPGFGRNWPTLSLAEVRAIVAAAHRRDRLVTAHVSDDLGLQTALEGGVDELAHIPCTPAEDLLREAARRRIPVVATLHVRERCPASLSNARVFVDAGGVLLYGSDYGNEGIPPGIDVEELRLLVSAGLTRREALAAATAAAARQLGRSRLGTLAAGAPADLIAVRGDPLRDLAALERIELAVAGGMVVADRGRVTLPPG